MQAESSYLAEFAFVFVWFGLVLVWIGFGLLRQVFLCVKQGLVFLKLFLYLCVWRLEDNLQELVLFLSIKLGSKCVCC